MSLYTIGVIICCSIIFNLIFGYIFIFPFKTFDSYEDKQKTFKVFLLKIALLNVAQTVAITIGYLLTFYLMFKLKISLRKTLILVNNFNKSEPYGKESK